MDTFEQFKETFEKEVKSEIYWDFFGGFFMIIIGVTLTILIGFDLINYSGSKTFHLTASGLIIFLGVTVLYWIKIRYRITSFEKSMTDDEIEKGIKRIREKHNMDVLKKEGTCYTLFFKPGTLTAWTKVNLFYDNNHIYINARPISKGNVDFGFGKRLERKLANEIKTCR